MNLNKSQDTFLDENTLEVEVNHELLTIHYSRKCSVCGFSELT